MLQVQATFIDGLVQTLQLVSVQHVQLYNYPYKLILHVHVNNLQLKIVVVKLDIVHILQVHVNHQLVLKSQIH